MVPVGGTLLGGGAAVASAGGAASVPGVGIFLSSRRRRVPGKTPPGIISDTEFENRVQEKFGGEKQDVRLSKARASGHQFADIDLVDDSTLTQVKRVIDPDATFGTKMREQFAMTVDAAQASGRKMIRYVVANETPQAFVDEIRAIPLPDGISLTIERVSATK